MEIKNAITVHRIWQTLPDADLIATFQFDRDAEHFCKSVMASRREPEGTFLVMCSRYSGAMLCFHPPKKEPASEARSVAA